MMRLLPIVLVWVVAACGQEPGVAIDASGTRDMICSCCNPVAQTGCAADEKCTWIQVGGTEGVTSCVPDGTVVPGGACVVGPPGETTGFDDCIGGSYCAGGTCAEICVVTPDSCADPASCVEVANAFVGTSQQLGVCDQAP